MEQHWSGERAYEVPTNSSLADTTCEFAGCDGRVFVDVDKQEMWVTDGPGIVLFRCKIKLIHKERA
jgi:hypothetical protein